MKRPRTLINLALVLAGLGAVAPALVGGSAVTVAAVADHRPAEMVLAAAERDCRASITPSGGVPWRSGLCARPAYSNHAIPRSPVLNSKETDKLKSL